MALMLGRAGKVKVSSLIMLVLLAAAVYYGLAFGGVYWRRYRLGDIIDDQLAFAGQYAAETIRDQIAKEIREMDLPPEAGRVRMTQPSPRTLQVRVSYTEKVNLLFSTRNIPVTVTRRRTY